MLPALGFLGLGPWYYDNGAVEITRADERHDRVDAVTPRLSRADRRRARAATTTSTIRFRRPTTTRWPACFRNGTTTNTRWRRRRVVDEFKAQEKKIEKKQELLGDVSCRRSREQLAETLAFQAVEIHGGGLARDRRAEGRQGASVVESQKLDYELFDRWLRFLEQAADVLSRT